MAGEIKISELKNWKPRVEKKQPKEEGFLVKLFNTDISFTGNNLPDKFKESFYAGLGTLVEAGVDIKTSLEIIKAEQSKKKYSGLIEQLTAKVVAGSTISAALENGGSFSAYEYKSIRIGEETGRLNVVLNELSLFYNQKIKQRRQIISAVSYPAIVIVIAISAVSFMISYVVPMFADIFKRFGGDLPAITKLVLRISETVRNNALFFLSVLISIMAACIYYRKRGWFRKYTASFVLKTPFVGKIVQKTYMARFANTMSLLMGSKVPLLQALELVNGMVAFYPLEHALKDVSSSVLEGRSLHQSMEQHKIFPSKLVAYVKVGEEVNKLEEFFAKSSKQYAEEVEFETNILSKLIEPFIIVILGVLVGVILIAMYLPLFSIGQNI